MGDAVVFLELIFCTGWITLPIPLWGTDKSCVCAEFNCMPTAEGMSNHPINAATGWEFFVTTYGAGNLPYNFNTPDNPGNGDRGMDVPLHPVCGCEGVGCGP